MIINMIKIDYQLNSDREIIKIQGKFKQSTIIEKIYFFKVLKIINQVTKFKFKIKIITNKLQMEGDLPKQKLRALRVL